MNNRKLYIISWIFKFIPPCHFHKFKAVLLRWAGAKIGKGVEIMSSVKIMGDMELIIGDYCYIGHEALIFGSKGSKITIEDYAKIGSRVIIVTGSHRFSIDGDCIEKEGTRADITIKRGSAISTASIIVPGITINEMSHCAAGCVVTKNVPAGVRVAGVPAKIIKDFKEDI